MFSWYVLFLFLDIIHGCPIKLFSFVGMVSGKEINAMISMIRAIKRMRKPIRRIAVIDPTRYSVPVVSKCFTFV